MDLPTTIEHARRAFALQKYEQAVEHYATALELMCVPRPALFVLAMRAD